MVRSSEAEARKAESAEKATWETPEVWELSVRWRVKVGRVWTWIGRSAALEKEGEGGQQQRRGIGDGREVQAEARRLPSGLKARDEMLFLWPSSVNRSEKLGTS